MIFVKEKGWLWVLSEQSFGVEIGRRSPEKEQISKQTQRNKRKKRKRGIRNRMFSQEREKFGRIFLPQK